MTAPLPPRVFIVNEPLRLDPDTKAWVKKLNLRPALKFGDLVHLLPAGEIAGGYEDAAKRLRDGLETYRAEDLLLLVGDPCAMAIAAAIAADRAGGTLRLLRWEGSAYRYELVELADVFGEGDEVPSVFRDVRS